MVWSGDYFPEIRNKETLKTVHIQDYQKAVENLFKDSNNALRKKSKDRKALEERCKLFLESLRGFTDWDTGGGTMKEWKDYQLKRWEAYKDLNKKYSWDFPESSTTLKGAREYLKEQQAKEKNGK